MCLLENECIDASGSCYDYDPKTHECFKPANFTKDILELVNKLTDEQRYDLFHNFCVDCGSEILPCHCMNDD